MKKKSDMKQNSEDLFKEVEDFFASEPSANQKAWGLIHEFYHMLLTYMEKHQISKADLAKRLGKSRAAITQMFNKTPNITIKKMVEIADAIGLDIHISSPQLQQEQEMTTEIREEAPFHAYSQFDRVLEPSYIFSEGRYIPTRKEERREGEENVDVRSIFPSTTDSTPFMPNAAQGILTAGGTQ